jgi:hypothetical protein
MKKFILGFLAVALVLTAGYLIKAAYADELIPSVGINLLGPQTEMRGKIGYDAYGHKYQYVLNIGTTEVQGAPAYYYWGSANDYTVGRSPNAAGSYEAFAGVWYCSSEGSTTIPGTSEGWIQIGGVCSVYASIEAGTSIAIGDTLNYSATAGGGTGVTAGSNWLLRSRAAYTTAASGTFEGIAPRALGVLAGGSSDTATKIKVLLRNGI